MNALRAWWRRHIVGDGPADTSRLDHLDGIHSEGVDLYRVAPAWSRDPGVTVMLPEPTGPLYELSGEVLEILLTQAGYKPVPKPSDSGADRG